DYPQEGSIFPPALTPPTFIWHDEAPTATAWQIAIVFSDGSAAIQVKAPGERMHIGEIDTRCISNTNKLPELTPRQASAWTWKPDDATWEAIKQDSREHPATMTIMGWGGAGAQAAVSRGKVVFKTSQDPVGEPSSRVLFTGLHSCANCHSFSRDGKTLGMDLDGPANDKGLYVLASIQPQ